jgi:DNA-binding NarL/FixJ family response regulator
VVTGRDGEVASLRRFVATPPAPLRGLVLEGEAGIGKTTLWRLGVAEARAAGWTVLVARPAEGERLLPYAGLGDLLEPVLGRHGGGISPAQRDALDAALQRSRWGAPADRIAVSRATLALVRATAAVAPALVAVDDVQWLDPPTAQALEFALRRLGDEPVAVLVTRRRREPGAPDLERAMPALDVVTVGPLDVTALDELLRERLGLQLPRPRLLRLARVCGGNPYFALEIGRQLGADDAISVPSSLADALADRLTVMSTGTRAALLLAAACAKPTAHLLARAGVTAEALASAFALGLLEPAGEALRFTHPLLASVAYDRTLPTERRAAHRRLAAVATDAEERAIHLARGAEEPDAQTADELERAAEAAAARGGTEVAAELAAAAASLTPAADAGHRRRRLVAAAERHVAAGDPARGGAILRDLVDDEPPGPERAALLWRLADTIGDSITEPIRLCEQALREAGDDPSLQADIHTALGVFTWIAGDLERSVGHCAEAARLAGEAGDDRRLAIAIGELCHAQAILGVPWDRVSMQRALELERRLGDDLPATLRPSWQRGVIALVTDELDTARDLLRGELDRYRRLGDEPGVFEALFRLAELELRAGSWYDALAAAREAHALARQGGIEQEWATVEMALALVLAHVGDLDAARDLALAAHRTAEAGGDRPVVVRCAGVLGFVELSAGRPDQALAWLTPARQELQRMGTGELSIAGVVQNEIEALVAAGRVDEAEEVVAFVADKGQASGRAWHRAVAARGRALVASARGEAEQARAAVAAALEAHGELPQPFELARTRLAAGAVERRAKRWAAARAQLTAALELFDDLGAARWAELAATELARLPGRRPAGTGLTETERRIAELAAEGLANKEIAARLFVTVRTVEANLSRVYAKLGVGSRTELARRMVAPGG